LYLFANHQTLRVPIFTSFRFLGWPGAHLRDLFKHCFEERNGKFVIKILQVLEASKHGILSENAVEVE